MNDEKLKGCPFCEMDKPDVGVARYENVEPYYVICRTTFCGAMIRAKTRAESIEAWNRRPDRRAPSPVERAKDEVVEAAKNWKAGKWKAQGYPLRDEARLEDALARLSSSEGCAGKEKE